MTADNDSIQQRWSNVDSLLERLMKERQALISQYCQFADAAPYKPGEASTLEQISDFCQILLDYVSAGHFEVYAELLEEAESFADGSAEAAKNLLPKITLSTEAALEFNDLYEKAEGPFINLASRLSKLGELMEARFEYEDELIEKLHAVHKEQLA